MPVSGLSGGNLITPLPATDCAWYKGPTLVGAIGTFWMLFQPNFISQNCIDGFYPPQRPITKPFRMGISDISKSMSLGQTVSGRIYTGAVSTGDTVRLTFASHRRLT